ncbi:thioredoxin-dependent thiol peroxidase [Paenibacillus allorhizosphaerae]|uniref:thioredoxin-dependent peroxiredoxin n=1 Tax=Paenibacillus allorhizosphaerae TaxID=2849866 RepID=A0ABM8VSQ7_9BACL|nr:thioredoxin-dependent thiol peroxidase [Paenibacillus allorhizosphaerae]CAG7656870.1 Putative peroxiredoxin bcp [Paenibacillus allorhizosphaerae]
MPNLKLDQQVPDFTLPAANGEAVSLSRFKGKRIVIYFYPKDMTPGCTKESCEFRNYNSEYKSLNTEIIGISPDDLTSHNQFISEYKLPFLLLSDVDHKICELFGVWKLKERVGQQFYGVERSTFLINEQGVLIKEWRAVQVDGHVAEVLAAIKQL